MHKLVLLYKHPAKQGSFQLNFTRNLALLKKLPGVRRTQVSDVLGGPAGESSYARIVELFFDDFEALDAALISPEGVAAGKNLMSFAANEVELLFVETTTDEAQSARPLGPDNLKAFIEDQGIQAEIVYPGAPTPTVPAAAEALGVDANQIVKSVVFLVDGKPFLVYGCGTQRVDSRKLAQRLNISRKKVRLANAEQVLDLTGYAVGTVPPVGLKTPMPAFLDPAVQDYEIVYAGGGGINALLKLTSAELLRASKAEIAPMLETDEADDATTDESDEPESPA